MLTEYEAFSNAGVSFCFTVTVPINLAFLFSKYLGLRFYSGITVCLPESHWKAHTFWDTTWFLECPAIGDNVAPWAAVMHVIIAFGNSAEVVATNQLKVVRDVVLI